MSSIIQRSFSGGEIAPSLYARVDTTKYANGLRTLRNFLLMRHGGASNRPGTQFICEVKDSSKRVRLIPFVFNTSQTYVLEFGNLYMRVIKDGALLESSPGVPYEIVTPYAEADLSTLNFVQSADVITIVHPTYAPRQLARTADTSWTLTTLTFQPAIASPTGVGISTAAGTAHQYVVTAVAADTYEESLPSSSVGTSVTPSGGSPVVISWSAVTGALEYNVYKLINGVWGYLGIAGGLNFTDIGLTADSSDTAPNARDPFSGANNYPSVVGYVQQRQIFAATNNNPETCYGSRIGSFKNFTISSPIQDDDAVTFTLAGRQVNRIKNLLDLGRLLVFTESGEWAIEGDGGVITPSAVNPKQYSYNGSSSLPPLVIGGNALYVQARGSIVRDLGFDYQVDGYRGNDLTVFSAHLFEGHELVDWTYQQIPHSIAWAVRDDGVLLGLTYLREHEVAGWHRHDFGDDQAENVCAIPDGTEDAVYVVVNRTIDGSTKRYIEKLATRVVDDIVDSVFCDSSLSYDGRGNGSETITLSEYSSAGWLQTSTITVTRSSGGFVSGDVGNEVHVTGADGTKIRISITTYVSSTVVRGTPNRTVPAGMRSTAMTDWARAVDVVDGLDHLEGKEVSVFADGLVVASPYNSAYTTVTVSGGEVELDRCYGVIHVGLPYVSDFETLDIDTPQGETMADKKKIINRVSLFVEKSRGAFAGASPPSDDDTDPLEGLDELKLRSDENYDDPIGLKTGVEELNIKPEWNSNGRIFIRQLDPLPLSILAVVPAGRVPIGGQ